MRKKKKFLEMLEVTEREREKERERNPLTHTHTQKNNNKSGRLPLTKPHKKMKGLKRVCRQWGKFNVSKPAFSHHTLQSSFF